MSAPEPPRPDAATDATRISEVPEGAAADTPAVDVPSSEAPTEVLEVVDPRVYAEQEPDDWDDEPDGEEVDEGEPAGDDATDEHVVYQPAVAIEPAVEAEVEPHGQPGDSGVQALEAEPEPDPGFEPMPDPQLSFEAPAPPPPVEPVWQAPAAPAPPPPVEPVWQAPAAPAPPPPVEPVWQAPAAPVPPPVASYSPPEPSAVATASGGGLVQAHPELLVGAAFAGGLVVAMILRRLGR
jgi:hypothetical protein